MASYYVWSGASGSGTGADWANAFTTLALAAVGKAAGDILFFAHDHSESTAGTINISFPGTVVSPIKIICVNRAGSVPPVSADRRTTAQIATTANTIGIAGFAHFDGIILISNSGATTGALRLPNSVGEYLRFDNCSLRIANTSAASRIDIGNTNGGTLLELNNTTVSFGAVGQSILVTGALRWRNTPSALLGIIPTTLMTQGGHVGGQAECIGVDLSAAGSGKTIVGALLSTSARPFTFIDCKLDAAVTKSAVPLANGSTEVDFVRSGASGVNYTIHRHRISGLLTEETTIVRTGGASDGTTSLAWKIVTTANCSYSMPFECPPIAIWNDTTGAPVTATVEGVWGGGAVPLDNEIWLDVEYLGDASSPHGSFINDGTPDLLATPTGQSTSTATWGGSTTKFKLAVLFTAQQKGWIYARVKCAKASSTFYIDPLVTLS